jgi:magnesium transporter
MDADEQARIEKEDEYTRSSSAPVYDDKFEVSYFTVPLGIILFSDKIVTICQRSSEVLEDIVRNRVRDFSVTNKSAFVLNLFGRAALVFLRGLKDLNKKTTVIERELQKSVKNYELIQLLSIQKSLVYFTTSLKTNELLLEKLQKSPLIRFRRTRRTSWRSADGEQAGDRDVQHLLSILTGTMDAFASVISNN